jgi:hypothetical protein
MPLRIQERMVGRIEHRKSNLGVIGTLKKL